MADDISNGPVRVDMRLVADRPVTLVISVNSQIQVEVATDDEPLGDELPSEDS